VRSADDLHRLIRSPWRAGLAQQPGQLPQPPARLFARSVAVSQLQLLGVHIAEHVAPDAELTALEPKLEEVDADAQGVGRLTLREREPAWRRGVTLRLPVIEDPSRDGHAPQSHKAPFHPPLNRTRSPGVGKSWASRHPNQAVFSGPERPKTSTPSAEPDGPETACLLGEHWF